jgi:hypothetical protein
MGFGTRISNKSAKSSAGGVQLNNAERATGDVNEAKSYASST